MQQHLDLVVGEGAAPAEHHPDARPLRGLPLPLGHLLGVRGDHVGRRDEVRLREGLGGLEVLPVQARRMLEHLRCEVARERVAQAELRGQLGAERRGAEDVQRHVGALAGVGVDAGDQALAGEVALQLEHVLREALGRRRIPAQRLQRPLVGAGGATQAQVDAAGVQLGQGAELLGDHQRRVVGQHDAAGAEADRVGVRGHVRDEYGRGGGGDGGHVVVLRVPDAPEAGGLGDAGLLHGFGEGFAHRGAVADEGEVQQGQRQGGGGGVLGHGAPGLRGRPAGRAEVSTDPAPTGPGLFRGRARRRPPASGVGDGRPSWGPRRGQTE